MKAYKPINMSFEKKVVFSYATLLSLFCFFIILSPVLAQNEDAYQDKKPKAEIDIKKQYDEQGNIVSYDSSYTWSWHGNHLQMEDLDSVFSEFHKNFDQFSFHFPPIPHFFYHDFPFVDTTDLYSYDFDHFKELFDKFNFEEYMPDEEFYEKFQEEHNDFQQRYEEYLEEHQRLNEKYFGETKENNDKNGVEQNKYSPRNDQKVSSKATKV